MWLNGELDEGTQAGEETPPLHVLFPCDIIVSAARVIFFTAFLAYRLRGKHWKLECSAEGRQVVAHGLVLLHFSCEVVLFECLQTDWTMMYHQPFVSKPITHNGGYISNFHPNT